MGPERLYHEPPDAIYVDLAQDGQPLPETERYFIVPDLIVNNRQIQIAYGMARDLGLTPKMPDSTMTVGTIEIDRRVFRTVTDLTNAAEAQPNLVEEIWEGIRARCQRTTNEAQ